MFLLIAGLSALAACQPAVDDTETNQSDEVNQAASNRPAVPLPEPPMNRSELLLAVARAASSTASGADDEAAQRALDGRRFEIRIRFGCRGPAPELAEAMMGWTFDRENRTLRLRAMPSVSTDNETVRQVAADRFEAVEGFWIPRPWLLDPACPAAAAVLPGPAEPPAETEGDTAATEEEPSAEDAQETEAPPPAWPKVGIAQFFTDTDPRTRRRDMRPYQTVKTLQPNQQVSPQGYNLVLSGRLRALPGEGVINCTSRDSHTPPDCIVSADFDRVWMEQPATREVLAEWGSG